eukprot:Sspe_Gene.18495::Locus_6638_Transcript_1_1_Confidence_1.000_Length_1490::g.18495::m.18495
MMRSSWAVTPSLRICSFCSRTRESSCSTEWSDPSRCTMRCSECSTDRAAASACSSVRRMVVCSRSTSASKRLLCSSSLSSYCFLSPSNISSYCFLSSSSMSWYCLLSPSSISSCSTPFRSSSSPRRSCTSSGALGDPMVLLRPVLSSSDASPICRCIRRFSSCAAVSLPFRLRISESIAALSSSTWRAYTAACSFWLCSAVFCSFSSAISFACCEMTASFPWISSSSSSASACISCRSSTRASSCSRTSVLSTSVAGDPTFRREVGVSFLYGPGASPGWAESASTSSSRHSLGDTSFKWYEFKLHESMLVFASSLVELPRSLGHSAATLRCFTSPVSSAILPSTPSNEVQRL